MSPIHLGFLAASGGASKYFIASFYGGTGPTYLYQVDKDSLGNIVAVGATNYDYFALKMNELGPDISYLRYSYKTGTGSYVESFRDMYLDASNNIYIAAYTPEIPSGEASFGYIKLNSSLGVTFARYIYHAENLYSNSIASDGTNVWLTGYETLNGSSASRWMFTKNSTSNATASVQRTLYTGVSGTQCYDSCLDSSGNLYMTGYMVPSSGDVEAVLAKIDTGGNLSWARRIGQSSSTDIGSAVMFDGTNIILAVRSFTYGINGMAISFMKFNTSGTLVSQTGYSGGVNGLEPLEMVKDSQGNIYAVLADYDKSSGTRILKLDSKFNLLWQRNIYSTNTFQPYSITVDANDDVYVSGTFDSTTNAEGFIIYYPKDGSVTGTYVIRGRTITIAAATDSIITSPYSPVSISLTSASHSFSDSGNTITASSMSDTPVKVNI